MRSRVANLLVVGLGLGFLAAFVAYMVVGLDNSPQPTEQDVAGAVYQWEDLDETGQNMVCNLFAMMGPDDTYKEMLDEGSSVGLAKAKVELLERECDDYLR